MTKRDKNIKLAILTVLIMVVSLIVISAVEYINL